MKTFKVDVQSLTPVGAARRPGAKYPDHLVGPSGELTVNAHDVDQAWAVTQLALRQMPRSP